eukprot:gnl/MRDRNA2_/MRDRNA2_83262_c0_seq1.p1 gnl/MRDRNA2_/MRDRNA2_83262_c0~~gnl/MRDRNA2_/MRDRNA2_83262_c0_seq1.p1  ORF type:complete len:312 (+),score=57.67 gnl/MRDRNA2_/MRDRNA2_83262_c0_seq1:84-1019(+)
MKTCIVLFCLQSALAVKLPDDGRSGSTGKPSQHAIAEISLSDQGKLSADPQDLTDSLATDKDLFMPAVIVGIVIFVCIIMGNYMPSKDDSTQHVMLHEDRANLDVIKPIEEYTKQELHQKVLELSKENGRLASALEGSDDNESLQLFWPRLTWLLVMLIFQSVSSIILEDFSNMLKEHPSIIYFLTMIVGAGGNVGGQSVVLMVRNLALRREQRIMHQCKIGLGLAAFLGAATFVRMQLLTAASAKTTLALCASMMVIVFTAVCVGTLAPLVLQKLGTDPAHASAIIQVSMDILGILVTCGCSFFVFSLLT